MDLNRLSNHRKGIAVLILLGLIWGYSVFRTQIGEDVEWAGLLIALGALSVFSLFPPAGSLTTALPQRGFVGLVVLFALFVTFQLMPLPIGLLHWLSPARAEIHDDLGALAVPSSFVSASALPSATMDHLMRVLAYGLVFFLVIDTAHRLRKRLWLLAIPILAIASLQAIVGLLQVAMGEPGTVARGGYLNRNHFSGLLEMGFPFARNGSRGFSSASPKRRGSESGSRWPAVCLSAATLLLIGILYSLSRMGFVACLFSILVMGLSLLMAGSSHPLRRKAVPVLVLLILLAFVFLPSDPLIARFADLSSAEEVSEQDRLQVWKETLGLIREFPWLGSGLGTYESVFLKHKEVGEMMRDNYAHNDYLQGLAELGLLGFSLVATFLSLVLMKTVSAISAATSPSVRYLAVACLGSMSAILLHSVTDFNLYVEPNAMLLSWVSAIGVSTSVGRAA